MLGYTLPDNCSLSFSFLFFEHPLATAGDLSENLEKDFPDANSTLVVIAGITTAVAAAGPPYALDAP